MVKVLILDDDEENCCIWRSGISEKFSDGIEVESIPKANASAEIEILLRRQLEVRAAKPFSDAVSVFDGVDILIIDYDLVHISEGHGRFTGEGICRLAHAYSSCKAVVILNQFIEADFDLSQRGNPYSSHADLNISSEHLAFNGLWQTDNWENFRPWHWPVLPDAAERLGRFTQKLIENADKPLLPLLGFTEDHARRLSDDAIGFIHPTVEKIEELMEVTLTKFLNQNSRAVDHRDGLALTERNIEHRYSLVASRLTKWMRRMVAGPRNLIVDLPHLVERFPFLMPEEKLQDINAWKELTLGKPVWLSPDILKETWVNTELWSRVPHIWLPKLMEIEEFKTKRYDFVYSSAPDIVFAEDSSVFVSSKNATQFKAEFNNEFDRRFVNRIDGIKYAPKRRFAL